MQTLTRLTVVTLGVLLFGGAVDALAATTINGQKLTPEQQRAFEEYQRKEALKHKLPPMQWLALDAGLADAKGKSKPAVMVFCAKGYKGAATFDTEVTRKALTDSGATPIRVLPPEAPRVPRGASADDVNKLREQYNAAIKNYQDTAAKYGVTTFPTMVFLSTDGDAMALLVSPVDHQVVQALAGLPKTIEAFKAAKARAEAANKPAN